MKTVKVLLLLLFVSCTAIESVEIVEDKYQKAISTVIGKDNPKPIVIHERARTEALKAFQSIKKN